MFFFLILVVTTNHPHLTTHVDLTKWVHNPHEEEAVAAMSGSGGQYGSSSYLAT